MLSSVDIHLLSCLHASCGRERQDSSFFQACPFLCAKGSLKGSPVYTQHASLHAQYTVMEAIAGLAAKGNEAITIAGGGSMPPFRHHHSVRFGAPSKRLTISALCYCRLLCTKGAGLPGY